MSGTRNVGLHRKYNSLCLPSRLPSVLRVLWHAADLGNVVRFDDDADDPIGGRRGAGE